VRKHAKVGRRLLEKLGLPRLAAVVGAHMVLPASLLLAEGVSEEELVYLADKLVVKDRVAGLPERTVRALYQQRHSLDSMLGAKAKMEVALAIARKVEAVAGRQLEDILPELRQASAEGAEKSV
jgi:molybdenum cofactor cytidylyltransferase